MSLASPSRMIAPQWVPSRPRAPRVVSSIPLSYFLGVQTFTWIERLEPTRNGQRVIWTGKRHASGQGKVIDVQAGCQRILDPE